MLKGAKMTTRILINGANGRMGQEACKAIEETHDLIIVAKTNRNDNLADMIQRSQADVVVDLTVATAAYQNTKIIIENNAHPVIGTSGLSQEQIEEFQQVCHKKQLGGIIVPNFSIGAVLMMRFAKDAAKYFNDVEIIELHHDKKVDAPSGTAIKTAQMIADNRRSSPPLRDEKEILPGARGAIKEGIHVHSIRLPGLVAHQSVIFGGNSETLTIHHDSIHRQSFMPGLLLSCRTVGKLKELVYGLENIL